MANSLGYKKTFKNGLIKASSKQKKSVSAYRDYTVDRMKIFDPYAAIKKMKEMNANLDEMRERLYEIKAKSLEKSTNIQSVKTDLKKECENYNICDDLKADGDSFDMTKFLMKKKRKPEQTFIGFYLQIESLSNNVLSASELVSLVIRNCNNSSLQTLHNSRVSMSKLELLQKLNQLDGELIANKLKTRLDHIRQDNGLEWKMCNNVEPEFKRQSENNVNVQCKGRVKKLIMQFELQSKI